jgi:hypothetical protein
VISSQANHELGDTPKRRQPQSGSPAQPPDAVPLAREAGVVIHKTEAFHGGAFSMSGRFALWTLRSRLALRSKIRRAGDALIRLLRSAIRGGGHGSGSPSVTATG